MLEELRHEHPELFVAPDAPAWPERLPNTVRIPAEARCFDVGGNELGRGHYLPLELADAIAAREVALRVFPGRCQAAIDALVTGIGGKSLCAAVGDGVADRAATECELEAEKPAPGYRLGTVITWALIGAAVGATTTTGALLWASGGNLWGSP